MAKVKTWGWDGGWNNFVRCSVEGCDGESHARLFYYPTYMNGDAELVAALCEKHKSKKLMKVVRNLAVSNNVTSEVKAIKVLLKQSNKE